MGLFRSALGILMKDWVMGTALTVLVLLAHVFSIPPLPYVERTAYDALSSLKSAKASGEVAVVAYDEQAVRLFGPPPAGQEDAAGIVDALSSGGVKVVALEFLYTSNQNRIGKERSALLDYASELEAASNNKISEIGRHLRKLVVQEGSSEGDELINALRASKRVVLPVRLSDTGAEEGTLPKWLLKSVLTLPSRKPQLKADLKQLRNPFEVTATSVPSVNGVSVPYDRLANAALAFGHAGLHSDPDGVLREEYLVTDAGGHRIPSIALQVVRAYRDKGLASVEPLFKKEGQDGVVVDGLRVPTGPDYGLLLGQVKGIKTYSFADVAEGKTPAGAFSGKVVFVGHMTEDTPSVLTPWGALIAPVMADAIAAENMLSSSYLVRPIWAFALEVVAILYFGIFITFVLPRVAWKAGLLVAGLSLLPWTGAAGVLFVGQGAWVMFASPMVLLVLGYAGAVARRVFMAREAVRAEEVETLKMLGLTFQGQGMLDMAFEKFMRCPVEDKSVRELLYNLGLDFERKRMPTKAVSVYEHILKAGGFKDARERAERLRQMDATSTFIMGGPGRSGTMVIDTARELPTLGRYEVVRELGRGAMGTVYLGRDPKINRDVAIKTLSYEDIPAGELTAVKERFFQEAAAAGKLSHPNIMTIYDAGEDHDLAFMAMELLSGEDLSVHCQKDTLLPPDEVMRIAVDVARALDYAHLNGVIHRDIKPSNIMRLKDGTVKVTDFGVARVVDTSRTSTGIVLGTPGYMSPEQVAGKKVTGQSDLFSLGAVIYELLTGEKAFKGENVAALMYNISRCSYTPMKEVASRIPSCASKLVDKLLSKGVRKRYLSGEDAAADAEACQVVVAKMRGR